jgi:hypothetical protein
MKSDGRVRRGRRGRRHPFRRRRERCAKSSEARDKELDSLRRQLAEMQKTLEGIAGKK